MRLYILFPGAVATVQEDSVSSQLPFTSLTVDAGKSYPQPQSTISDVLGKLLTGWI